MSDGIKHIMIYQMVNVIHRTIEAHVGPKVHTLSNLSCDTLFVKIEAIAYTPAPTEILKVGYRYLNFSGKK